MQHMECMDTSQMEEEFENVETDSNDFSKAMFRNVFLKDFKIFP